jgi:branched-chain amino acid transport system permease protein
MGLNYSRYFTVRRRLCVSDSSAAGLAIVFGMMGVINMAHGEFIMCGAVTVGLVKLGVPLAIAQALAALTAG